MRLPDNTRAELCRHLARLRVLREQIRAIEQERLRKLAAAPADQGPHAMIGLIARVLGVRVETADMLVNKVLHLAQICRQHGSHPQRAAQAGLATGSSKRQSRSAIAYPAVRPVRRQSCAVYAETGVRSSATLLQSGRLPAESSACSATG